MSTLEADIHQKVDILSFFPLYVLMVTQLSRIEGRDSILLI